jgi:hypothetical protein
VKEATSRQSIDAALKKFSAIVARLERCTDRLDKLFPALARTPAGRGLRVFPCLESVQAGDFDRYRWGCTVAASLAPTFDSREFSRAFRAAMPAEVLHVFDPVRLKKVLQRLCHEEVIAMTKAGRGRTPAHYRVLPRSRGEPSILP